MARARGEAHAGNGADRGRLRLHHRRCRVGGLCAGQSSQRRPEEPRAAARGRWQGQLDLVSYSGRLPVRDRQSALRLDVQDRARAGAERPRAELSARQGNRRLVGDQRHDLHARAGGRLRSLASAWADRLGLGRRAAAVQKADGSLPRRKRSSRDGRRVAHRGPACLVGIARCVPQGGGRIRRQADRRFQSRRQRGLRLLSCEPAKRPALVGGARLPQAGTQAAEPARRNRLPRRTRGVRRLARDRRHLAPGWRKQDRARQGRGHSLGRLDRLGSAAAAVRHRAGARSVEPGHPGRARPPGSWTKPAGSFAAAHDLQGFRREDLERDVSLAARPRGDGIRLRAAPPRSAHDGAVAARPVHPLRPVARARQHPVPRPAALARQVRRPAALVSGLHHQRVQSSAAKPRPCAAAFGRPRRQAGHRAALPLGRRGPPRRRRTRSASRAPSWRSRRCKNSGRSKRCRASR